MPRSLLLVLLALAACGRPDPIPTGSTCPPDNTLTYDNFGAPFMESYCTRCHDQDKHGAERHGAPIYHDFDTLYGILVVASHVDREAAAGPNAINRLMPYDGDKPTDDERYQLGQWLACEIDALSAVDAGVPADAGPPDAGP